MGYREQVHISFNLGMKINASKCEAIVIGKDARRKRVFFNSREVIKVGGEQIRVLGPEEELPYLGLLIKPTLAPGCLTAWFGSWLIRLRKLP